MVLWYLEIGHDYLISNPYSAAHLHDSFDAIQTNDSDSHVDDIWQQWLEAYEIFFWIPWGKLWRKFHYEINPGKKYVPVGCKVFMLF
jgi:hypothetical protein